MKDHPNLDRGSYVAQGRPPCVEPVPDSEGWYARVKERESRHQGGGRGRIVRVEWHWSVQWRALEGEDAGVPVVIELCQGEEAYNRGRGIASYDFHGPFPSPEPADFAPEVQQTICRHCWEAVQS